MQFERERESVSCLDDEGDVVIYPSFLIAHPKLRDEGSAEGFASDWSAIAINTTRLDERRTL